MSEVGSRELASFGNSRKGFALVAVLWMVAALAILVTGLTSVARSEIRNAQVALSTARAAAVGDAVIQLGLLEHVSTVSSGLVFSSGDYEFDGYPVRLEKVPAAGLVNLNHAPGTLLHDLFLYGAELNEDRAELLAQRVLEWRDPGVVLEDPDYEASGVAYRPRRGPFEYAEDLLQVLGVEYDLYAKISRIISVYGDSPVLDPMAAPSSTLLLLAAGNRELADTFERARVEDQIALDFTALIQAHIGSSSSQVVRLDAFVEIDGSVFRRTQWIDLGQLGAGGLVGRVLRVDPVIGLGVTARSIANGI